MSKRVVSSKIVKAKKEGICWICGEDIVPQTLVRATVQVVDGKIERKRTCHQCREVEGEVKVEQKSEMLMLARGMEMLGALNPGALNAEIELVNKNYRLINGSLTEMVEDGRL